MATNQECATRWSVRDIVKRHPGVTANDNELQAIAPFVIGGVSLSGSRGNVLGTLVGALIITHRANAMNLNGVQSAAQAIVAALIILVAMGLDMWCPEISRLFRRIER